MWKKFTLEFICFLVATLFLYTGLSKLVHHSLFVSQLGKSPLLTDFTILLSWTVPIVELVITFLLYVPSMRRWALAGSFGLMVGFTFYVAVILIFYEDLPCSCGGVISMLDWNEHLVFNIIVTLLTVLGMFFHEGESRVTDSAPTTPRAF
jgi:methylamine utilization protein MauE